MKLCEDCRWIRAWHGDPNAARCTHPMAFKTIVNPVDGSMDNHQKLCVVMRDSVDTCGHEAKLWEPKEVAA